MQFIKKIVDKRNRKFVFYGLLIMLHVIDAEPPRIVFFFLTSSTGDAKGVMLC